MNHNRRWPSFKGMKNKEKEGTDRDFKFVNGFPWKLHHLHANVSKDLHFFVSSTMITFGGKIRDHAEKYLLFLKIEWGTLIWWNFLTPFVISRRNIIWACHPEMGWPDQESNQIASFILTLVRITYGLTEDLALAHWGVAYSNAKCRSRGFLIPQLGLGFVVYLF